MRKEHFRDLLTDNIMDAKIILLGIPYDGNASVGKGACMAPDRIRKLSSYLPALSMDGDDISSYKIYDKGNVTFSKEDTCLSYFKKIEEESLKIYQENKFNLFIGGDHSVSIPTIKAFYEYATKLNKIPVIIHIDAHPDICDVYDNSKYSHACPNARALENGFQEENITMIGIRGFEKQEIQFFSSHPSIKVYNASYINKNGIDDMLIDIKNKYDSNHLVYISYDIDANDPSFAPGTGTPEAFGLKSIDTLNIILFLIKHLNVCALDLVEISPKLDCNDITSWLGLKTIYEVINELIKKEK